ncbi:hypothetical protein B0O80DRAFT_498602 [Mortierella sp. GBAus27b]|nr:hypothetical protein BGX31_004202 [Mortierella sp. GBA43]KAI8353744.1 hypothetical protein B0O80DRAFT_498602 [Mortierella sp. GBAus27b]
MNFLFATSTPNMVHPTATAVDKQGASSMVTHTASTNSQDIELLIDIESSFHGVLLGLPDESPGAVLNATAILHVRKKPIRASKLTATFDGRIKVQCSDGATFGPEQYRERVLAHKDWVLWEAGSNNTHNGSGSKNHIPVGTHYYPLSIQLDGALPPTFSGKHGSIRYVLSTSLLRPIFHSDINTVKEIEVKRCLVSESSGLGHDPSLDSSSMDLGSLLVNHLSRAGISGTLNGQGEALGPQALSRQPLGPTTITHHNTHKELLRYTSSSPPIAHLEGGLIYVDLALEPLPPGSYVYSIAYGLKEMIYYRSSATGNMADNKSEILYPIGQQIVIIPRDQDRERDMASIGAGASTRQLLELRPCPLLTNVDISTPLIEIQHRITCNVAIVLPSANHEQSSSGGDSQTGGASGGGILRRLNLLPQPLAPSLNLVDSSGVEATNNAVLLGEPTHSIIEPALIPANLELNDAPPPPPPSQIESTVLEFPIILTSRYPTPSSIRIQHATATATATAATTAITTTTTTTTEPISFSIEQSIEDTHPGNDGGHAYQALATGSYSSQLADSPSDQQIPVQQFVHNRVICPTIIPTTGTAISSPLVSVATEGAFSSSPSSTRSSNTSGQEREDGSLSSTTVTTSPSQSQSSTPGLQDAPQVTIEAALTDSTSLGNVLPSTRAPMQSGISAGLRAAAAAAAAATAATTPNATPISPPPSYGRQAPSATPAIQDLRDELPKYEDVVDTGPSGTVPQSTSPIPMASRQMSGSYQSGSGSIHSPNMNQTPNQHIGSYTSSGVFSASPPTSPSSRWNDGTAQDDDDRERGQASSPRMIRGHARTGSTASPALQSASLARSAGQSFSSVMNFSMTPVQHQHPHQQHPFQRSHQRQRSVGGAAIIIGSLGQNGGYLSQQGISAPLCMSDVAAVSSSSSPPPPPVSFHGRHASPPAYADISR